MLYPTLWLPDEGHHVTSLGWLLDRAATLEGQSCGVTDAPNLAVLCSKWSSVCEPTTTGVSQMEHGLAGRQNHWKVGAGGIPAVTQDS